MDWEVWVNSTTDVARLANTLLSGAYLVMAATVARRRLVSRTHNRVDLLHQLALAAMALAVFVGSMETLVADSPAPGVRTYFFTLGLVWTYLAEWARWRDKNPPNREDHSHDQR